MSPPTILCPIDFSIASRGALRYALAIAEHFAGRVVMLTVSDPLLQEAVEIRIGSSWLAMRAEQDLTRFLEQVASGRKMSIEVKTAAATGKPATEILNYAQDEKADLIVMSSRGNSGVRKLFFGATTERVLRETTVPVLVTPAHDQGPLDLDRLRRRLRHILVPVDFMGATSEQMNVAHRIASAVGGKLLLAHVVEPLWFPTAVQPQLAGTDAERRHRAEQSLIDAVAPAEAGRTIELLTAFGDPAEEIAKIAADRSVGLIVMGLHASPRSGPRMGSVTYRVLCLAPTLVLALPPTMLDAAKAAETDGALAAGSK